MDGVTDGLMRGLLTSLMPFSYCVTEFLRVSGMTPPAHVVRREVPELPLGMRTAAGVPVQLQILGGIPERMAETAARAVKLGVTGIDINFGCPAPTVNRHDGGATLLKFPDRIEGIVSAVRAAVPRDVPVSAKLRLGWDDPRSIHENAERAVRGGVSWITIHGRTKTQGYTPPAYWKPIGEVRSSLGVPVVANGEIWSLDDLKRCQDESGCIHVMLGRGSLADLELVDQCAAYLGISRRAARESSWSNALTLLIEASVAAGEPERRTLSRLKQWGNYAQKRGNAPWFEQLKRTATIAEVRELFGSQGITLVQAA